MIDDAYECRRELKTFCEMYPELSDLALGKEDWVELMNIRAVLMPLHKYTLYCSTVQPTILNLAKMYRSLGLELDSVIVGDGPYRVFGRDIRNAVRGAKEVFSEYYEKFTATDYLWMATMLDPRIRTRWVRDHVPEPRVVITRIKEFLKATYPVENDLPVNDDPAHESMDYQMNKEYYDTSENLHDDIDRYFEGPTTVYKGKKDEDQAFWVASWWNANQGSYPQMALAPRDFLAIPESEVDCERLFNGGRDILGIRRYAMSGDTMRPMMLLKDSLRNKIPVFGPDKHPNGNPNKVSNPKLQVGSWADLGEKEKEKVPTPPLRAN